MIPYTTIPFLSALFLVAVGILVGNLVWYRFRDEQEGLTRRLQEKNRELKQAIATQSDELARLAQQWSDAESELLNLRTETSDARWRTEQLERAREEAVQLARQEQAARQNLQVCLDDESRQRQICERAANQIQHDAQATREELSAQLAEWEQVALDRQQTIELQQSLALWQQLALQEVQDALRTLQHEHTCLEQRHGELTEQLRTIQDEKYGLQEQLARKITQAALLQQQQAESQTEERQLKRQAGQLRDRLAQLETQNDALTQELQYSAAELAAKEAQEHQLDSSLDELAQRLAEVQRRCDEVETARQQLAHDAATRMEASEAQSASYQAAMKETSLLKQQLDTSYARTRQLEDELRQLTQARTELAHELESATSQWREESTQCEQLRTELESSQQQLGRLTASLHDEHQQREAAESALEASRAKQASLRQELERLAAVEDQLVALDADYCQARDELRQLRKQRDQVAESELSTREIVAELRDELDERLSALATLRRDKDMALGQLELEQRQRGQLQEALVQAERRLAAVGAELDRLTQRHSKLAARHSETEEKLAAVQQTARDQQQLLTDRQRENELLAQQVEGQQQLIRKLQRKRLTTTDSSELAEGRVAFSFRELRTKEQVLREDEAAKMRKDPILGILYHQPPLRRDDLKKIPGIADRLERQLNQLGVYTFRQVMEWNDAAADEVARRLALGNAIRNDDWVGVARQLHEGADGAAA
jgi:predicted flap endonuclease-1-like 5' DNA nuclease